MRLPYEGAFIRHTNFGGDKGLPGAIWRQAQTSLKRSEMGLLALPDVVLVGNRPVKAGWCGGVRMLFLRLAHGTLLAVSWSDKRAFASQIDALA